MRNSPVRKRIVKGTVELMKGKFERLNDQDIQSRTSPSKRGVLKCPKKNNKKRTGSAKKKVVLDRQQSTIDDFFAGVKHERQVPEASLD